MGTSLLAGAIFRPEAPYGTYRIGLRILDRPTSSVAETAPVASVTISPNPT
jgi:hypothetical protein